MPEEGIGVPNDAARFLDDWARFENPVAELLGEALRAT